MAGGSGAAYRQHLRAGLRSQAGGSGASGTVPSMVPPIGGTVYGGTVWCRLLAARYTEARLGGGRGRALRGLAKDA